MSTFIEGIEFHVSVAVLTNNNVGMVTSFSRSASPPASGVTTEIVSTDDSRRPIIIWLDGTDLRWFSESPVVYLYSSATQMFENMRSATQISFSGILSGKTVAMNDMFYGCRGLVSLDLSGFRTNNVTNMADMFSGCTSLRSIIVSESFVTDAVTSSSYMFLNCTSLVGGAGTAYDSSHTDGTYARIDNPPDSPGYFTEAT